MKRKKRNCFHNDDYRPLQNLEHENNIVTHSACPHFCVCAIQNHHSEIHEYVYAYPETSTRPLWATVFILSNGDTLYEGKSLKLGKGTMPNGDFNFIATASNTNEAKLKRSTTLDSLLIIKLSRKGDEKYGYKWLVGAEGGYNIQFENAVATGEIIYESSPANIK